MPNLTSTSSLPDMAIDRLNWSRQFLLALLGDLSGGQWVAKAGGVGNHPLWVTGHIAHSDDFFLSQISGLSSDVPAGYTAIFAGGSAPTNRLGDYPAPDEVLAVMHASRQRLVDWIASLDSRQAVAEVPEHIKRLAPTNVLVAFAESSYEMFHAGQVAAVRASLGLPRTFS